MACVLAAVSLRGVASCFSAFIKRYLGDENAATPSYWTIRLWMLRIGYYKLIRSKQQADDWVWIVDHTVQTGPHKCFVVLGVRLSALGQSCVLTAEDVEPLAIEPVLTSNGEIVDAQFEEVERRTGVPQAIIMDNGSDLHKGGQKYSEKKPGVIIVGDITHKCARELKKLLEEHEAWAPFTKRVNQFKREVQQTPLAALAPPAQRTKSRYMNVDVLAKWTRQILIPTADDPGSAAAILKCETDAVTNKLSWVEQFRGVVTLCDELALTVEIINEVVRTEGYGERTPATLDHLLPPPTCETVERLQTTLRDFVADQSAVVIENGLTRLPGSTEILESGFGRLKRFEGEQAHGGLTGSVLTLAAFASTTNNEDTRKAVECVKVRDVRDWVKSKFGQTTQAARRLLRDAFGEEQKQDHCEAFC